MLRRCAFLVAVSLWAAASGLQADYVFYGPHERALSGDGWQPDPGWKPAFERGAVTVYALPQP